jgi:lysophospholipase L1-like esterase
MDPAPFLRGNPYPGVESVPYPRAKPTDFIRLPFDTWSMAQIPAGVRLEISGDAVAIDIDYETQTDQLYHPGAGKTFAAWRDGKQVAEEAAALGEGRVRIALGSGGGRAIVYLPAGMKPQVRDVAPVGGAIEPAPPQARWLCYGDSIAEGWIASHPALAWPAIVGREHGLDVINMGYAGAARAEIVSAEHIADLPADVISITHGTNCWTRIPHSTGLFREGLIVFLDVVRVGHPETPVVVASPVIRPDAETTPNKIGATLADFRRVMEEVVAERIDAGDKRMRLVPGGDMIGEGDLGDGIHPSDEGHRKMAAALGPAVRDVVG